MKIIYYLYLFTIYYICIFKNNKNINTGCVGYDKNSLKIPKDSKSNSKNFLYQIKTLKNTLKLLGNETHVLLQKTFDIYN
jgi:hypothetical protein